MLLLSVSIPFLFLPLVCENVDAGFVHGADHAAQEHVSGSSLTYLQTLAHGKEFCSIDMDNLPRFKFRTFLNVTNVIYLLTKRCIHAASYVISLTDHKEV